MSINRDEALRAIDLAEGLMKKKDFTGARKLACRAQKMDSSLENISRMIMVCDVHCAATEKSFGNDMDWYAILQVEQNANDIIIKKQYKRLALLLHPDKNKLPGAEAAFKFIGEAQMILLDRDKRMHHDIKRKSWRKPVPPPPYKTHQVPNFHTQPVFQARANMRNIFNEFRPENRHPYQKPQAQPAAFSNLATFWTICAFCRSRYEYHREYINKEITCQSCRKRFTAFEEPFQGAQPAKGSGQTTYFSLHQNKFPGQKAFSEPHKQPENPASVSSSKASFPMPSYTAKDNGKRKRKNMIECSESSDSESSSDSEDVIGETMPARDLGSNGGEQPRRSSRSKRKVSYNENLSDDDVDLVNQNEEGSEKNIDTEREEEPEEKKQTHEDHSSTESIKTKEKIKEDQVETSAGACDSEEDLSSGSAVKPNVINCGDPDFNDFDKLREKSRFEAGQMWAVYDEEEGMPRFYAIIKKVTTPDFMLKYVWLEVDQDEENETPNLPVSVGKFEVGNEEQTHECTIFSHLVRKKTRKGGHKFKVFPEKGEIWALFKHWDINWSADSESPPVYEYEFVEILSNHAEGTVITVGFLSKVEGFSCVFCPMPKDGSNTCEIPPHEFCRFSHRIPSFRLTGTEGRGVLKGWFELDPAALPVPLSQNLSGEEAAQDQDHQSPPPGSAS